MSAPKIVDVRTKNSVFLRPSDGEKPFEAWVFGREGQECLPDIQTRSLCLCGFSSLNGTNAQIVCQFFIPVFARLRTHVVGPTSNPQHYFRVSLLGLCEYIHYIRVGGENIHQLPVRCSAPGVLSATLHVRGEGKSDKKRRA